ncbi:MAG: PHP domain-containing protein [Lacrimispora sp.]|uniref:PHP domain-containing protein n=1 Tax=Lacrimispora sp. TaxID=2719234 RepID=UPI0039E52A36
MEERVYLLPKEGEFYKANMSCHTTVSDGKLTPEQIKKAYQSRGYQIAAYTDLGKYCAHGELHAPDFLALAGFSVDMGKKGFRINFYDTNPDEMKEEKENCCESLFQGSDCMERMNQLGFLASLSLPYQSMGNYEDYKELEGLSAMEIYNYSNDVRELCGYHPQVYDEMLRCKKKLFCLASDGNRNEYPFEHPLNDSFGGFTKIKAKELTYEAVMEALKKGDFYSSMGPEIHSLYIEGNELVIKTGPVQKIYVKTEGRNCHIKTAQPGEALEEARFSLTGREGYIRIVCGDENGLFAASNAYFLSDLLPGRLTEQV